MSQARCTGTTKRGQPCRSFALPSRPTCIMHAEDLQASVRAARQRGGTAAAKLRLLTGRRLKLDTTRALVRFLSDVAQDTLSGAIDPNVSRAVVYAVSVQKSLIESADIEERLDRLERQLAAQSPKAVNRWA